jgi:hypothetical protein
MEDFNTETDSDYTSYWRDWVCSMRFQAFFAFFILAPYPRCSADVASFFSKFYRCSYDDGSARSIGGVGIATLSRQSPRSTSKSVGSRGTEPRRTLQSSGMSGVSCCAPSMLKCPFLLQGYPKIVTSYI